MRLQTTFLRVTSLLLSLSGALGCGNSVPAGTNGATTGGAGGGAPTIQQNDPGSPVELTPSAEQLAEVQHLEQSLAGLSGLDAAAFAKRFPTSFEATPSYDPANVQGLEKIQASTAKLNDAELAQLSQTGFVISQRQQFPSFASGYASIYADHLPLYVSADSLLNAIHKSYDDMLAALESTLLTQELDGLLAGMQQNLAANASGASADAVADSDVFLAVARSLLAGQRVAPVAGGSAQLVQSLFDKAQAHSGVADVTLFGVTRKNEDFSQFEPRGHYTDSPQLSAYFRAMMWLGRIDLRLLETQEDGSQVFRRRQLEVAFLLRQLIDDNLRPHFDRIDRSIAAFVGEPDYMLLSELDRLASDLGVGSVADLAPLSDERLAQAIIDGNYGAQRISSHIMINGGAVATLPLSRSFALLGQRYTVDSHVFSNVVYDRITSLRMMPNPLDAAFAAMQNDQAGSLLGKDLGRYDGYPEALARTRQMVDEHPPEFWSGSLYTLWLDSLRQLSPSVTSAADDAQTLFPVARTEAWGRRLLNTQLASWAELRHDTILYAKQSYTGGPSCEFPDAYVDPYPSFYRALSAYGAHGLELLDALELGSAVPQVVATMRDHFTQVSFVADALGGIAENQRAGADLTPEMLAFLNEAVVVQRECGGDFLTSGWYKKLFWNISKATEFDPTIADVHTEPMDEAGNTVGRVLHVGTAAPRVMVVVADTCGGPRAYAGLVSAYREKVTENFERLTDEGWKDVVGKEPEVPWLKDVVAPAAP